MLTIEKHREISKTVDEFIFLSMYGMGMIKLETRLELKTFRIFQVQANNFWSLEGKYNWLEKIYIQAQKDLAEDAKQLKKFRISDNPESQVNFVGNLTKEWYENNQKDKALERTLLDSYESDYNWAGQRVLTEFKITESFKLRNIDVLDSLARRAQILKPQIDATGWDMYRNRVAQSFWREGKGVAEVARDIRDLFEKTYKHRAENIARTETGEIVSEATYKSYDKMGIPEVKWIAEADADNLCLPLKNKVIKTGEYFDNGKGWRGRHPLVHPRCRCAIVAKVPKKYVPSTIWTGD